MTGRLSTTPALPATNRVPAPARAESAEAVVQWSERLVYGYFFGPAARDAEVRRALRASVARRAATLPDWTALFVPLEVDDLDDLELYSRHAPLTAFAARTVLQLNGRGAAVPWTDLRRRVGRLRGLGFRIGLDDVGSGFGRLAALWQLHPDFVKLEPSLVRGIDGSPGQRSVVRALCRLCAGELGMQVVAAGVATTAEREALAGEGCDLMHGPLFRAAEGR